MICFRFPRLGLNMRENTLLLLLLLLHSLHGTTAFKRFIRK